jgi:hypothetical protein
METPTIPLAFADLVAVALSALGTFLIARLLTRLDRHCGQLASLGFWLIALGGLSKNLWMFVFVATELNVPVLNNSRLILLAPGFVLMAWAIWKTFNSGPGGTPIWVVPVIIIVVGCGAAAVSALSKGGRRWFFILLGLTVVANLAVVGQLIKQATSKGLYQATALFAFAFVMIVAQAGLASLPEKNNLWQWSERLIHLLSWGAFAFAAWQLERSVFKRDRAS